MSKRQTKNLLSILVTLVGLAYLQPDLVGYFLPFFLLYYLLPKRRVLLLAAANLFLLDVVVFPGAEEMIRSGSWIYIRAKLFLIHVLVLVMFYLYALATHRFPRLFSALLLIGLAVCAAPFSQGQSLEIRIFFIGIIHGLFCNAYYLRTRTSQNPCTVTGFLANQQPFFITTPILPVGALFGERLQTEKPKPESVVHSAALMSIVAILVVLKRALLNLNAVAPSLAKLLPYDRHLMSPPIEWTTASFTASQHWLMAILMLLNNISETMIFLGSGVALIRLLGFDKKSPVYDLLGARSLFSFFERQNYYYCQVMLDFFIYPIFRALRFAIKEQRLRFVVAAFIGIPACGLIAHYLLLVAFNLNFQMTLHAIDVWQVSAFWFLLATAVCVSIYFERKSKASRALWLKCKWLGYFVFYAFLSCFFWGLYWPGFDQAWRLRFIRGLFGI